MSYWRCWPFGQQRAIADLVGCSCLKTTWNESTVTPALHKRWQRLVRMSWDEISTRAGQEAGKRLDLASYRLGLRHSVNGLVQSGGDAKGDFLFSVAELPVRTALLKTHLSTEVNNIISEADEILQHRFRLLGYENVQYGAEIDWHLDTVHGKKAPLKPWFKIRYLDFEDVGDHKITWELNRHQHLVTLAKAWRLTGQERYIDELVRQWYGWQAANPYPMGINWSSSLEVGFRSLSWLWLRYLLADCQQLPAGFEADLLRGLGFNARYIERYLSTYFSPNTHLLGEAVALFFIGMLCPSFEFAQRLRDHGWRILVTEAQRQVRPDGVYIEQSLYYHVYALDFFLHARLLAARNQVEVPASFDMVLEKMLGVLSVLSQAGPLDGFGDDDGGRVFNPRRNRSEHLTDPLAIGALLFGRDDLKRTAQLTEESIWLFGEAAVATLAEQGQTDQKLMSTAFESGGIYVTASSENHGEQMIIDAGPQGTANSGHGHADALSVRVAVDGRRWLVDCGTYSYTPEKRDLYRGTTAHNTLRVDSVDQAISSGPFGWTSIPNVYAETWIAGETFDLFAGSHDGYSRLPDAVIHRRFVVHLHGEFWLVRDIAEGCGAHDLEIFSHFAPDLIVIESDGVFIAVDSQPSVEKSGIRLCLLPVEDSNWSSELTSGFVAPVYGRREPAPVVRCSSNIKLPAEHAVLLRPAASIIRESCKLVRASDPDSGVHAYRYDESGKSHLMIFAPSEIDTWTSCGFTSDARFLYACISEGRLSHFILCRGKSANFKGNPVLAHRVEIQRFEWFIRQGSPITYSSDEAAKNSLSGNVYGLFG